jgi:protoheme IX farnesyltransferase
MSQASIDKTELKKIGHEKKSLTLNSYLLNLKKYVGLTKPERTIANVITGLAGYLFASKWHIQSVVLFELLAGLTLIIASACVLNNIIDRDLDKHMERTKKRALASGEIPARSAAMYAAMLGVIGFWLLAHINWTTFWVAALAGYVGYVALYGYAKRKSAWGTLAGTISGGASIVTGYTAVTGRLDVAALLLFVIMAVWQMAHFYSIAIFRLDDYKKAGVPVWPAKHGVANTKTHIFIFVAAFIAANTLLAITGFVNYWYLALMVIAGGYWYLKALQGFHKQTDDVKWARGMFGISLLVLMVFAGLISVGSILS